MLSTRMMFVIGGAAGLSGHAGAVTLATATCRVRQALTGASVGALTLPSPAMAIDHALAVMVAGQVQLTAALAPPTPVPPPAILFAAVRVTPRLDANLADVPRLSLISLRCTPRLHALLETLPCL